MKPNRTHVVWALTLVLCLAAGCVPSDSGGGGGGRDNPNLADWTIIELADSDNLWSSNVLTPTDVAPRVADMALTDLRVTDLCKVEVLAIDKLGGQFTLRITNLSKDTYNTLWLILRELTAGAVLSITPDAHIFSGQPVFFMGPLAPGSTTDLVLDFDLPFGIDEYAVSLDFVWVKQETEQTFILDARPTLGGYAWTKNDPSSSTGNPNYQGLDVTRVNDDITVSIDDSSADGTQLRLGIGYLGDLLAERVWMLVTTSDNANLLTEPHAHNIREQAVFVLGPLWPGDSVPIELEFAILDPNLNFTLDIDFIEVRPRFSLISDEHQANNLQVYSINEDGSGRFRVNETGDYSLNPMWSPGLEHIGFQSLIDGVYQIVTVHPDGSHLTQVTDWDNHTNDAAFSPDGRQLIYDCANRTPDRGSDICINDVKGGNESMIISGKGEWFAEDDIYHDRIGSPSWSPDGRWIVFAAKFPLPSDPENPGEAILFAQRMDPWTHKPISDPFLLTELWPYDATGTIYIQILSKVNWAPDSQHVVLRIKRWDKAPSWKVTFNGPVIFDFQEAMDTGGPVCLADLASYTEVQNDLINYPMYAMYPSFALDGEWVIWDHQWKSSHIDLVYKELDQNYNLLSNTETPFIDGEMVNRMATWPPMIFPEYYPGIP